MKRFLIITLLLPILLHGQIPLDETNAQFISRVDEKVVCFTDRNLYLSGDVAWFSAFVFVDGRADENLSNVLYAELFNSEKKVIASAKYPIRENRCLGRFNIPHETRSGTYFIRFYTRYQRNFIPPAWELIPVTVINTGLTLPSAKGKSAGRFPESGTPQIQVKSGKTTYQTREKISLEITPPAGFNGWLNITVARKGSVSDHAKSLKPPGQETGDTVFHVPDVRGVSLSGFVTGMDGSGQSGKIPVYLSAFGNNNMLHITETKSNGTFLFSLNGLKGLTNVFVTIDPEAGKEMQLLVNTGFSKRFPDLPPHGFRIDSTYRDLLSAMLVDLETSGAYGEIPATTPLKTMNNLPVTYDFSVKLDDYIELASLSEVIYEIVPPVSVRSRDGEKLFYVANYQTQHVASAGLVLLDDVPVFDVDELLKIPPVNIDRIDVINRPYYMGDHLLESMVSLKTKTGDFGGYRFPEQSIFLEYQSYVRDAIFSAPEYGNPEKTDSPLPDFRTTLYWESALAVDGKATVTFYSSDARGDYDVRVRGVATDGGLLSGKAGITVK